jgi:transcription-repair coupling factor (superfamily II helicase)
VPTPTNQPKSPAIQLVDEFARLPVTKTVLEQVELGARRKVGGLWGASVGLLLAAVVRKHKGPLLVLTADDVDSLQMQTDLAAFGVASHVLPREEQDDTGEPDAATRSARQRALQLHASDKAPLLAGIEALLQKVATPKSLSKAQLELHQGQTIDRTQVLQKAQAAGLRSVPLVLAPGECSVRGDVVDLFPMGADSAVRLEFFDRTLESIRTFDAGSQRTTAVHERFVLALGKQDTTDEGSVLKHLTPSQTLVVAFEPLRIDERQARLVAFTSDLRHAISELQDTLQPCARLELSSLPSHDLDYKILSAGSAVGSGEADPAGRLRSIRGVHGRVLLFCRSDDERARLAEIFQHKNVDLAAEKVDLLPAAISRGFRLPDLATTALSLIEFAGVPQAARVRERVVVPSRAIQSFFELGPNDLVVHAVHGIARFEGTELVHRGQGTEEHLRLCFQDEVKLLVPASKIHLVQKYVGSGGKAAAHGLVVDGPVPFYRHVFPGLSAAQRNDLAYFFESHHASGADYRSYTQVLSRALAQWRRASAESFGRLTYVRGPGFVRIRDDRPGSTNDGEYTLTDDGARIFELCDEGRTSATVCERLRAEGREPSVDDVEEFLEHLVAARLVLRVDGRYLSLPLCAARTNPRSPAPDTTPALQNV